MSYSVGDTIKRVDIINKFNTAVVNKITKDTYDLVNPPMDDIYQCVPSDMLDNLDNITVSEIGLIGQKISASTLVNALIETTKNLTRVGTFTYARTYHSSRIPTEEGVFYEGKYYNKNETIYDITETVATKSGKVLFKADKIRNLSSTPTSTGITAGSIISIANINSFCSSCLSAWNNTSKYEYSYTNPTCHDSCHSNCHGNCYGDCHGSCYSD